jgi:hypothetical protein
MKGTHNAEEENGVSQSDQTDSGREEKPCTAGSKTDGSGAQAEPPDAYHDQRPDGQKEDRNSVLKKYRAHGSLWDTSHSLEILIMEAIKRKAESERIWKYSIENRENT